MFVIFAVFIMFGLIEANFNTWRFEKNEMIHRKGIFAEIKRYPTANLRYLKKIPDIFEYIIISSGSLTIFITGEDPILIPNVIGISRVAHRLDNLLSQIKVKMVE
jgi:hypothetical protein